MQLYLIRHAQSENNILTAEMLHKRLVDPALTDLGLRQRDKLADFLASEADFGIDQLYTSAMYRSLLTAQPLGEALGLQPQVWLPLHELGGMYLARNGSSIGFGGMTRTQITSDFPGYQLPESVTEAGWYAAETGFEPLASSIERALAVARTLREWRRKERRIALVSHAGFLNLLLGAIIEDSPMQSGWRYYHNNTAITRIDYLAGGPVLHYMNRVDHLPADMRSH